MNKPMRLLRCLLFSAATIVGAFADAADRIHAGEWETTVDVGGKTFSRKACVTTAEASAMNASEAALRQHIKETTAPAGCTLTDVKASGSQVTVDSVCHGVAQSGTSDYHGDSYESVTSNGTKVHARRVGVCP